jgi:hypothetical protein
MTYGNVKDQLNLTLGNVEAILNEEWKARLIRRQAILTALSVERQMKDMEEQQERERLELLAEQEALAQAEAEREAEERRKEEELMGQVKDMIEMADETLQMTRKKRKEKYAKQHEMDKLKRLAVLQHRNQLYSMIRTNEISKIFHDKANQDAASVNSLTWGGDEDSITKAKNDFFDDSVIDSKTDIAGSMASSSQHCHDDVMSSHSEVTSGSDRG